MEDTVSLQDEPLFMIQVNESFSDDRVQEKPNILNEDNSQLICKKWFYTLVLLLHWFQSISTRVSSSGNKRTGETSFCLQVKMRVHPCGVTFGVSVEYNNSVLPVYTPVQIIHTEKKYKVNWLVTHFSLCLSSSIRTIQFTGKYKTSDTRSIYIKNVLVSEVFIIFSCISLFF